MSRRDKFHRPAAPAAVLAACLIAGLVLGEACPWPAPAGRLQVAACGFAACAAAVAAAVGGGRGPAVALIAAALACGCGRGALARVDWERSRDGLEGLAGHAWVSARLAPGPGGILRAELLQARPAGRPAPCAPRVPIALLVSAQAAAGLAPGWWEGLARIDTAEAAGNPGDFPADAYLRARGAAGWLRPLDLRPVGAESGGPAGSPGGLAGGAGGAAALRRARGAVAGRLELLLPAEQAAVARALLMGRVAAEPGDELVWAPLREAGVGHLLAVSGLHVGLLAGFTAGVLRLLPLPGRARLLLLALLLAGYGALTGWSASVTRAACGGILWCLLRAAGRAPEGRTLLAAVLAAHLWAEPGVWRDLGCRLTYIVTFAILGAAAAGRGHEAGGIPGGRPTRRVALGMVVMFAAQSAAWPLLLASQGWASPIYLAANLLVVPLAGLLLGTTLLGLLFSLCPGFPADIAGGPARALIEGLLAAGGRAAAWAGSLPLGGAVGAHLGAAGALAVAVVWHPRRLPLGARAALAVILCAAITLAAQARAGQTRAAMLDVGQGESWMLLWPGETWVVDLGPAEPGDARATARLARALRQHGRRRIDRLFLTHDDADHTGALPGLVASELPIDRIHFPDGWTPTERTAAALAQAVAQGARLEALSRGDTLAATGARRRGAEREEKVLALVLHPPRGGRGEGARNEGCLGLLVAFGAVTIAITADSPAAVLEEWVERGLGRCTIVSAAHHGSADSTPRSFLEAAAPEAVLVSAGRGNRHGHPATAVLERIAGCGAWLLRTDRDGQIRLRLSGGRWILEGHRSGRSVELETATPPAPAVLEGGPRPCYKSRAPNAGRE
ncbi:MAG: ComEC/Rec2 family competence protein [Candidatus Eisenbacteria bacterium]|uniref:ComEC/Rec2 family competence protein n=1 Tax=Eiseniibacteriota bacterium TaxID=2212470 RepID=A0A937XCB8_UNCEI|nr:ComEC/Rec2 family competence protein [Candidatus Eisenbacteria bacterium]